MVSDILELLFWMAVEDPWDMVWTTAGFGLLGVTILRIK